MPDRPRPSASCDRMKCCERAGSVVDAEESPNTEEHPCTGNRSDQPAASADWLNSHELHVCPPVPSARITQYQDGPGEESARVWASEMDLQCGAAGTRKTSRPHAPSGDRLRCGPRTPKDMPEERGSLTYAFCGRHPSRLRNTTSLTSCKTRRLPDTSCPVPSLPTDPPIARHETEHGSVSALALAA